MEYRSLKEKLQNIYSKFNNKNISEIDYFLAYYKNVNLFEARFCKFSEKDYNKLKRLLLKHLKKKVPIQKLFNKAYFYKREFFVNNNVLTPREDTEILVEQALSLNFNNVLDLCAGSGAIGITLKCEKENINLTLADISTKALKVCRKNLKLNNVTAKVVKTNMFKNINDKFDLIVCNPPYIETDVVENLSEEVKNFDPHLALDGGNDGLKFYNVIFNNIENYLTENGKCLLEIGYNQGHLIDLFSKKFKNVKLIKDYNNLNRVIYFERG